MSVYCILDLFNAPHFYICEPAPREFPAFDVNKYKRQIEQLSTAAYSKTMDDNPVAQGLREYLAWRQTALDSIAGTKVGIGAKKNRPVLLELEDAAVSIIEKYPAFKRVYDRVLSKELDY